MYDKLTHLILEAINAGLWTPTRASKDDPQVSHLMFADDVLLFGEASIQQIKCVQRVLDLFYTMLGQTISAKKSNIYLSKNVDPHTRNAIVKLSSFNESNSMERYLGVPLLSKVPRCNDFQYLVERVSQKLSGWTSQQFFLASQITLAKSVIQSLSIYLMVTTMIPKTVLEKIQKTQRYFIWGDHGNTRDSCCGVANYDALLNSMLPNKLIRCILPIMSPYNDAGLIRRMWPRERLGRYTFML